MPRLRQLSQRSTVSLHLAPRYLCGTHRIAREQRRGAALRGAHLGVQPVTPRGDLWPPCAAANAGHRNRATITPPQKNRWKKACNSAWVDASDHSAGVSIRTHIREHCWSPAH